MDFAEQQLGERRARAEEQRGTQRRRYSTVQSEHRVHADATLGLAAHLRYGHDSAIAALISFGEANTIEARSPCMPAPTATGWPGRGPSLLESVLKRRLNSQIFSILPSAVSTV